jgi:hypothetical protein
MDTKARAMCDALAKHIVDRRFADAHGLLASWLRDTMTPDDLQRMVDAANEGLPAPRVWTIDEGFLGVDDLREADPYGPPSEPVSPKVTAENFRGWLCIQFKPEGSEDDATNVCFDLWLAAVEDQGVCLAGFVEAAEAS